MSDNTTRCIGPNADDGCGYVGGESYEHCPKCGGMLLSDRDIAIADQAAKEWEKRDAERYVLYSWVKTSSVHAHPHRLFAGILEECERRRDQSNFPGALGIAQELPSAY